MPAVHPASRLKDDSEARIAIAQSFNFGREKDMQSANDLGKYGQQAADKDPGRHAIVQTVLS